MITAVTAVTAGCGGEDGAAGDDELQVVASFYPLAEVARQVGGDRVAVSDLTPAGAEPHDLELRPDQVDRLEDADLVVVLGGGFQPAVEDVAERRGGATLAVLEELEPGGDGGEHDAEGADDGHGHDGDPHVWLDPSRMAQLIDEVAAAMAELDPEDAAGYRAAAAAYREDVLALDAEMEASLASCRRRTIVVSHAAFGWLAARYDLRQEAVAGLAPEQEADPRRLGRLVDLVRREEVTTVFTEPLVSPEIGETLAREAGVRTAVLNPLEGLTRQEADAGEDYLSVMRSNLAALVRALDCPS